MKYRPDIDGLRAIAIIPVVLFHAEVVGFGGGFIGVDVFFVISGFLITSLLLQDIQKNRFSIAHFYERRVRRIFPALMTVFAACAVAAYILLLPQDLILFAKSLVAAILFASNFHFMSKTGYFDAPAESHPLLHTWSLSVEEQFYIFFPLILWFLAAKKMRFGPTILVIFVSSLIVSLWATAAHPKFGFYMLPSRTWEMMLGSLLALNIAPPIQSKRAREIAGALGLLLILVATFTFSKDVPFPGWRAFLPCFGALS